MIVKNISGATMIYQPGTKLVTQSEYDKATITYPVAKPIYKTQMEKRYDKVVDADGKEHILRTYEVEVPVTEKKLKKEKISKINPDTNEDIFEEIEKEVEEPVIEKTYREMVRYNPYDAQGVVIIPDDAKILTEDEYKAEIYEPMNMILQKNMQTL